jgi:hypothetical protein
MVERIEESWSKPRFVGYGMYVITTNDDLIYLTDIQEYAHLEQGIARTKLVNGRFAEFVRLKKERGDSRQMNKYSGRKTIFKKIAGGFRYRRVMDNRS